MIWNTLLIALREIRRNLMRAFLTTLGIVIGVSAVITMVTLGNGATRAISAQVASLGSNLLMVTPGQRLGPGRDSAGAPRFKLADAQAIEAQIPGLAGVAPIASSQVTVVAGGKNWSTGIQGSDNDWFLTGAWKLATGRTFSEGEERAGAAVCVVGDRIRKELFGNRNPVGGSIRVKQFSCEIVGLLKPKGQSGMGRDQDDVVVMPLRTLQRRLTGNLDVGSIMVSVKDGLSTSKVQNQLELLLRERRHIADNEQDNFNVMPLIGQQFQETAATDGFVIRVRGKYLYPAE